MKVALTKRELDMLRIAKEAGPKHAILRWEYVNSRIATDLPGPTIQEGVTTQFNAGLQDMAELLLTIIDYALEHHVNLGTAEELIDIVKEQVTIITLNALDDRKRGMN